MGYTLEEPPTGASDLAESLDLSIMAKEGLGYGWQQNFVRSALARNFDYGGMMDKGGSSLVNAGLLHSGAMDAQLPAEVAGYGQAVASDALLQADTQSTQFAQRAQDMLMQVSMHDDQMTADYDLAKAQLEAGERDWWDYVIGAASVGANVVGMGQGVGLLSKL